MKKFILLLIILFVFALGLISGLAVGKNKFLKQQGQREAASLTKHFFKVSDEEIKAFALKENYRAGLAETFKDIPLSSGVKPSGVWSILKPYPGIVYTVAASKAEVISFYEEKLKASGWVENHYDEIDTLAILKFGQPNLGRILVLFIDDKPPSFFPPELGLKEQTFVNFFLFFSASPTQ